MDTALTGVNGYIGHDEGGSVAGDAGKAAAGMLGNLAGEALGVGAGALIVASLPVTLPVAGSAAIVGLTAGVVSFGVGWSAQ